MVDATPWESFDAKVESTKETDFVWYFLALAKENMTEANGNEGDPHISPLAISKYALKVAQIEALRGIRDNLEALHQPLTEIAYQLQPKENQ